MAASCRSTARQTPSAPESFSARRIAREKASSPSARSCSGHTGKNIGLGVPNEQRAESNRMSQDLLTTNRSESPAAGAPPAAASPWIRTQLGNWLEQAGMLAILAVLVIVCSLTVNDFFTLRNLDSLLLAVSTVGIISCTMLFCLASGNFDLSVGTIVPCAGVVAAVMINKSDSIL